MDTTVVHDGAHYSLVSEKARLLGKTPEQYVQALIDADGQTFDEILQPVRQGFESMNEEELDGLFDRAKKAARESKP